MKSNPIRHHPKSEFDEENNTLTIDSMYIGCIAEHIKFIKIYIDKGELEKARDEAHSIYYDLPSQYMIPEDP
jgi:hypothetical protein